MADEWIKFVLPVRRALKKLIEHYLDERVNCPGRGWVIRNAVRQSFMVKPGKITASARRRLLSHMLQGIESKAVYETIMANPGVCGSIEHDGLVSSCDIHWNHPYLVLNKKH